VGDVFPDHGFFVRSISPHGFFHLFKEFSMRFFLPQGLWHYKDFLKFWTGETISAFGSQVTAFALPITAALTLHATAIQMGTLSFLAFALMLFLSLFDIS
jgi:hypothetical protein